MTDHKIESDIYCLKMYKKIVKFDSVCTGELFSAYFSAQSRRSPWEQLKNWQSRILKDEQSRASLCYC